ncbi:PREDICTED: calponin homology domain-containing protein DDB_G0272472 [Tarenaya hassleriana]|uniref:calponin homology domain-containing protein DDB_G0272472 n=1 Tax=Tarenaya hassleriana TaxID=28532 RepID=UPI00053C7AEA|nr:PREDICTED: calponin homology domain-containing protein DDB_G0272472 [Tarenaya hassleriana]
MLAKAEKKRKQKRSDVDTSEHSQAAVKAASNEKSKVKKDKLMKKKPRIVERNSSLVDVQVAKQMDNDVLKIQDGSNEKSKVKKDKLKKRMKKKPKIEERNSSPVDDQVDEQMEDDLTEIEGNGVQTHKGSDETANAVAPDKGTKIRNRKSKKSNKKKRRDPTSLDANENYQGKTNEVEEDEVYQISSGDEDCSRGMKKWVTDYYTSRPGLKELQKRIDDFIIAHEERLEQERKEREAKAEEGGWTVVVHHKGRKKTTDSESGITVGSVAQAAVEDKLAKKKQKETVAPDFYRFQKREAHRNELMALQSKFEQDKKRIQQLRAARKFKPY